MLYLPYLYVVAFNMLKNALPLYSNETHVNWKKLTITIPIVGWNNVNKFHSQKLRVSAKPVLFPPVGRAIEIL